MKKSSQPVKKAEFVLSGADEPMDTSLPPDERAGGKDEPMETEAASKPRPPASTPVSQNSPGFVLERTLSVPSQPEFSHVRLTCSSLFKQSLN